MRVARIGLVLLGAVLVACSKEDSSAAASDTAQTVQAADTQAMNAAVAPQAGTGAGAPLAVADIDRWQKGMEAELAAVKAAGDKMKSASSSKDSLDAMSSAGEMSTLNAGASASGLDPERYKFVRSTLSAAALSLSPMELEMKDIPPAMIEEFKKNGAAQLERMSADIPSEVVEALRPRATDLRKQHMLLVGERLKASGIAGQ